MYSHPYNVSSKQHCYHNGRLRPEVKLKAVERIINGETKASVARSIDVPESTLRGWVKNAEKIRFTVDRILFTKNTLAEFDLCDDLSDASDVKRLYEQKQEATIASQHNRPWTNTEPSRSKNNGNYFGSDAPPLPISRYSPSNLLYSHLPTSTRPPVISKARQYKDPEQSLFLRPYPTIKQPRANNVPLDMRLPVDLSISPNPVLSMVGTSGGSVFNLKNNDSVNKSVTDISTTQKTSNVPFGLVLPEGLSLSPNPVISPVGSVINLNTDNNKSPESLSILLNPDAPQVSTSGGSAIKVNDNNNSAYNNNNDSNNNNYSPDVAQNRENCDHIIDAIQALWYAEKFYHWFQTFSDPTITIQDFKKFAELLERVKKIAAAKNENL